MTNTPVVRVLLVTGTPPEPSAWEEVDGSRLDLDLASGVAVAADRISVHPADVVILDAALALAGRADLPRLRASLGPAPLLIRADDDTPDLPWLLDRVGGASCVLPASAPAAVQRRIAVLAAERARLAAQLRDRAGELEARTRELARSEIRFRDVIERNADAILVVDPLGVIRFANEMAISLFRTSREALVGRPFGFPVVAGETTELDLLQPGQSRVVEMRLVESEWEGERAYIASLRDITERKRAEEGARHLIREQSARAAAEAAASRFRFLAEATTLLAQSLDYTSTLSTLARLCVNEVADWAVVYVVNERGEVERLEVAHRDPAKGEAVYALREHPIAPGGRHPVLEVLQTRVSRLVTGIDDARLAGIAEDERHYELIRELGVSSFMLVPLIARDRELGAVALVSSDPERPFTEEDLVQANDLGLRAALALDNARLYDEAQKANQAKTNLLAVISHDLRTPLNSIIGHTDLLSLGIPEPLGEATLERVGRIRIGASHLLYLIDELLAFARLDGGHEELHLQQLDATVLSREVASVVEPIALERGLGFHLDVPRQPVLLRADPDRLRQVLLNLVGNGLKYTREGEVRLELRAVDERVEFRVRDTGIGIEPEHLDRIFEPFWQADASQRGAMGGTGLGLSVVRGIVRMLDGEIEVSSEVGRGSTFTVRFPAIRPV